MPQRNSQEIVFEIMMHKLIQPKKGEKSFFENYVKKYEGKAA